MSRNMKRLLAVLSPLLIFIALLLDLRPGLHHEDVIPARESGATRRSEIATSTPFLPVLRVVDGDTIDVSVDGNPTRVRLIGINAPESVDPRRPLQCFGKEASAYMHTLLDGRSVRLTTDPSQDRYDKYGRLLAYVYRDDSMFINEVMIDRGYAYEYTFITPYLYQQEFKGTEQGARTSLRGLWASTTCGGKL